MDYYMMETCIDYICHLVIVWHKLMKSVMVGCQAKIKWMVSFHCISRKLGYQLHCRLGGYEKLIGSSHAWCYNNNENQEKFHDSSHGLVNIPKYIDVADHQWSKFDSDFQGRQHISTTVVSATALLPHSSWFSSIHKLDYWHFGDAHC